jgi:hypothetical protein
MPGVCVSEPSLSTGSVTYAPSRRYVLVPLESTFDTRVSRPLYVNVLVELFGYVIPGQGDSSGSVSVLSGGPMLKLASSMRSLSDDRLHSPMIRTMTSSTDNSIAHEDQTTFTLTC